MKLKNYKKELNFLLELYDYYLESNRLYNIYKQEFTAVLGRVLIQALIDIGYSPEQVINKMNEENPNGKDRLSTNLFQNITFPEKFRNIILPNEIEQILESAFENSNLKTIDMRNAKLIDSLAFKDCKDLTEIIISDTLKNVYRDAFSGCTNLSKIIVYGNKGTVEGIFKDTFKNVVFNSTPKIYFKYR